MGSAQIGVAHEGRVDQYAQIRVGENLPPAEVAEVGGRVVGHVAISPVTISEGSGNCYGLGPISVLPDFQSQGIGSLLMRSAIAAMRDQGARGIVLLGDPAYYARFGFEHDPHLTYPGPPPEYFQRLVLAGDAPRGVVAYAPAFG